MVANSHIEKLLSHLNTNATYLAQSTFMTVSGIKINRKTICEIQLLEKHISGNFFNDFFNIYQ